MSNSKKVQSLEMSAKIIADKITSILPDNVSARKIVEEIVLPTIGSEADIQFWKMVAANIG